MPTILTDRRESGVNRNPALVVGVILILCGVGVLARNQLSRWVGVFASALGAVTAIWWMPYYPIWSLTYIILGVALVYALLTHAQPQSVA
jgi:hypothetical protein